MPNVGLATLMTDFGTRDPYVAAMKGVILAGSPVARIVDISHEIAPHDVLSGAFVWVQSAPYYPAGTVHVGVVDPGVGSDRKILVAACGQQVFLFPDNGLITFIAAAMPMEGLAEVQNIKELLGTDPSQTFHGRDIFAPIAAQLLNGMDLYELGPEPESFTTLDIPDATAEDQGVAGEIIYVDHFGNLISNIPLRLLAERWEDGSGLTVTCGGKDAGPINATYSAVPAGSPLSLFNSMGVLEIAVNRGSAATVLGAQIGTEVRVAPR